MSRITKPLTPTQKAARSQALSTAIGKMIEKKAVPLDVALMSLAMVASSFVASTEKPREVQEVFAGMVQTHLDRMVQMERPN